MRALVILTTVLLSLGFSNSLAQQGPGPQAGEGGSGALAGIQSPSQATTTLRLIQEEVTLTGTFSGLTKPSDLSYMVLSLSTIDGDVDVLLGPAAYVEMEFADLTLTEGDELTILAGVCNVEDESKYYAITVTVGGTVYEFRDPETYHPEWAKGPQQAEIDGQSITQIIEPGSVETVTGTVYDVAISPFTRLVRMFLVTDDQRLLCISLGSPTMLLAQDFELQLHLRVRLQIATERETREKVALKLQDAAGRTASFRNERGQRYRLR